MRITPSLTVAVIGAGIVGLTAALEILRSGHRVIIIEPSQPGGRQAASYGNGTSPNPGAVMPISAPGLWRKVPGFLADPAESFHHSLAASAATGALAFAFHPRRSRLDARRDLRRAAIPAVQGYGWRPCGAC